MQTQQHVRTAPPFRRRLSSVAAMPRDAAALQRQLSDSRSAAAVLELVGTQGLLATFDHIHLATAVHRVSSAADGVVDDPRYASLLSALSADGVVRRLNAQGVANVLCALARLHASRPGAASPPPPPAALLAALQGVACQPKLWTTADPQAVANTAWACARLGGAAADVLALLSLNVSVFARFKPLELANYAWAYGALLAPVSPAWAQAMEGAADQQLLLFSAQELSMTLLAFSRLRFSCNQEFVNRAAVQLERLAPDNDQSLSNGLLALAKLNCTAAEAVTQLVKRSALVASPGVSSQGSQAVVNALWAAGCVFRCTRHTAVQL